MAGSQVRRAAVLVGAQGRRLETRPLNKDIESERDSVK